MSLAGPLDELAESGVPPADLGVSNLHLVYSEVYIEYNYSTGILLVQAGIRRPVEFAYISTFEGKHLVAVPFLAWRRLKANRNINGDLFSKVSLLEVVACSKVARDDPLEELTLRVRIGFLDVTALISADWAWQASDISLLAFCSSAGGGVAGSLSVPDCSDRRRGRRGARSRRVWRGRITVAGIILGGDLGQVASWRGRVAKHQPQEEGCFNESASCPTTWGSQSGFWRSEGDPSEAVVFNESVPLCSILEWLQRRCKLAFRRLL